MSTPGARLIAGAIATLDDYPVDAVWIGRERLVVGGGGGELAVIDAGSGEARVAGRHEPGILNVVAHGGPDDVVSAGQDGTLRRWSMRGEAAEPAGVVLHRGMGWPQSLAVSADAACWHSRRGAAFWCSIPAAP